MRTAVFSDVHGNLVALDAMLADLADRRVGQLVCLGDALQGGPQPLECAERIAALGCPVILGNADSFVLTLDPGREPVTDEQLEVARWTRKQLRDDGLALIRTYVPTVELGLGDGRKIVCFHGSPTSYDDVILPSTPEDEVRAHFSSVDADVIAGGHVHMQWARPIAHRILLNPGSVGMAYDHEHRTEDLRFRAFAEYAVVGTDGAGFELELRRVPFDRAAVARAAASSSRPHAHSYAQGWR